MLEKPAENLLKWKDIDINFCFSWDSTPWTRTWGRISAVSVWDTTSGNQPRNPNDKGILIEQKYGREKEWKEHFEYLLPFFMDKRYIKKENKPVFIFYVPQLIYCLDDMIEYWNKLSIENGLDGIYTIVTNESADKWSEVDASMTQEPEISIRQMGVRNEFQRIEQATIYSYQGVWDKILNRKFDGQSKVYESGFVDFDNTPRKNPATILIGKNPNIYKENLRKLLLKNKENNNDFVFINAWNEWGEGAYLEPDKVSEYEYLEATREAQCIELNDIKAIDAYEGSDADGFKEVSSKMLLYFKLMNQWMFNIEDEISVANYFIKNNYKTIAIYGYGHFAKHLIYQLDNLGIEIKYVVDKYKLQQNIPYTTFSVDEELPEVDAMVITPFMEYASIRVHMKSKIKAAIVSIEEVVYEMG